MCDKKVELKFLILGIQNTGKSAFLHRVIYGSMPPANYSTIGVDYGILNKYLDKHVGLSNKPKSNKPKSNKPKNNNNNTISINYKIHLWDAGGHDTFMQIVRSFYRKITGIIVFYDVNLRESFYKAKKYIEEYRQFNKDYHYVYLVGNKIDLDSRSIEYSEGKEYAKSIGAFFTEMSVKLKQNTDIVFDDLIKHAELDLIEEKLIPSFYNGVKVTHNIKPLNVKTELIDLKEEYKENKCCIIS